MSDQKALLRLKPEQVSSASECWQLSTSLWSRRFMTLEGEAPEMKV
jgi:hypothetical protein